MIGCFRLNIDQLATTVSYTWAVNPVTDCAIWGEPRNDTRTESALNALNHLIALKWYQGDHNRF